MESAAGIGGGGGGGTAAEKGAATEKGERETAKA